jgi:hypothetical protein
MIQKIKAESIGKYFLLLIILCLFIFIILKAFYASFTHDEGLSFKILMGDRGMAQTANHHLLNTWLMSIFYRLFGASEFVLRLPNVLAFCLYAFFTFKILSKAESNVVLLLGTALLFFNPYLIDFFTIARGYGLSLGFAMGAVYFLLLSSNVNSYEDYLRYFAFSLLFSLLAAYSNLILVNFSIAILSIFLYELFLLVRKGVIALNKRNKKNLSGLIILSLVFLFPLVLRLFMLKNNQQLYFGGTDFYRHTISQLIHHSIYFSYYGESFWLLLRKVIVILFGLAIIYQFFRRKYTSLSRITLFLALLVAASFFQYWLFEIPFPVGRTAIFLIPLFGLFICFFFGELKDFLKQQVITNQVLSVLVFLLFLAMAYHFAINLNLKNTREWRFDSNTKAMMAELKQLNELNVKSYKPISISNNWLFEPTINYYRTLYQMDYLTPADRDGLNKDSDYIYCTIEEMRTFEFRDIYLIVRVFEDSETVLLRRNSAVVNDF